MAKLQVTANILFPFKMLGHLDALNIADEHCKNKICNCPKRLTDYI